MHWNGRLHTPTPTLAVLAVYEYRAKQWQSKSKRTNFQIEDHPYDSDVSGIHRYELMLKLKRTVIERWISAGARGRNCLGELCEHNTMCIEWPILIPHVRRNGSQLHIALRKTATIYNWSASSLSAISYQLSAISCAEGMEMELILGRSGLEVSKE